MHIAFIVLGFIFYSFTIFALGMFATIYSQETALERLVPEFSRIEYQMQILHTANKDIHKRISDCYRYISSHLNFVNAKMANLSAGKKENSTKVEKKPYRKRIARNVEVTNEVAEDKE